MLSRWLAAPNSSVSSMQLRPKKIFKWITLSFSSMQEHHTIFCAWKTNSTWSHGVDLKRLRERKKNCICLIVERSSKQSLFMWMWMSVPIWRNAPWSERQKRKRPPTGQVTVIANSLGAQFSQFLGNLSNKKKKHLPLKIFTKETSYILWLGDYWEGWCNYVLMLNGEEQSCV